MNETEKAIASKLLTQILESDLSGQSYEISKYDAFMAAVSKRINGCEKPNLTKN